MARQCGGTLRNSGNTDNGQTRISNVTLKILGDASGMRSKINAATGVVVVLDATNTATMTSNFDVWKTGELQFGSCSQERKPFTRRDCVRKRLDFTR